MTGSVEIPLWLFLLILLFGLVTFASHFLFPSVRWFFRRRMERLVSQLNERLDRPIEPFKLAQRYDMIQRLIYDPDVSRAIAAHARRNGVPENVAFETARRYAREIVPSFSAWTYFRLSARLARWLARAFFRVRVVDYQTDQLAEIDPNATVVMVMNHRSNMDYVMLTYLMAPRGAISYAVGEWARKWPLSAFIRLMGAFFIRRRDANNLYRQILTTYVQHATRAGVTQAVFPEGGLSLTGALSDPRLGILKYIVDSYEPDGRDVVFVPVAVNYDRVLEDTVLIKAAKAGRRQFGVAPFQALRGVTRLVLNGRKGRRRRFGYAGLSFGAPLALSGHDGSVEDLAEEMMRRIGDEMPLLPVPMISQLLLVAEKPLRAADLELRVKEETANLPDPAIYVPQGHFGVAIAQGLDVLLDQGAVQKTPEGFVAVAEKRDLLTFYAGSAAHKFRGCSTKLADFSASAGS